MCLIGVKPSDKPVATRIDLPSPLKAKERPKKLLAVTLDEIACPHRFHLVTFLFKLGHTILRPPFRYVT